MHSHRYSVLHSLSQVALLIGLAFVAPLSMAQSDNPIGDAASRTNLQNSTDGTTNGSYRLKRSTSGANRSATEADVIEVVEPKAVYSPGEFETYVQRQAEATGGVVTPIRRFGAELVSDTRSSAVQDPSPLVPNDYVVKPGDEISVTLWGSVDADLQVIVDRSGRIVLPRVGSIPVAGVRSGELTELISRRVAQVFKNFQISVSMGRLRSVRVFVSGFVQRPGSLSVNSLSSVLHVVMRAGGPTAAGSFRNITLRRNGKVVSGFDLYNLLLNGDRSADQVVQADDVIHIGPVGPQVGLIGSINQPAVFELKPNETVADLLAMGGGFSAVADRTRVAVERLADRSTGRVAELKLDGAGQRSTLAAGDVVRVFSAVTAALPLNLQNKRIRVEGEVARPGDYVLAPNSTLADAIQAAGGLTPAAFVYGTEFTRQSVRRTQQENFDRALRDLETELTKNVSTRRATTAGDIANQGANEAANARLIERLRQAKPTGRIVLEVAENETRMPVIPIEDGDQVNVPARASTVGVFGSVYNAGSYLFNGDKTMADYLKLAGGPARGADAESVFVIRANGTVVSARQSGSTFFRESRFANVTALPGDTLFVPEELDKTTFIQDAKDWTQILYQFGLGLAGIKSLGL
ncbi:MAG: sugar ABC transporter substrate-binding protein [Burkholderiales bacterium PBB6]|nr:MAG: sugar ABC transporter substrate-binding protein [Burkholderiales bacterium PBB6]